VGVAAELASFRLDELRVRVDLSKNIRKMVYRAGSGGEYVLEFPLEVRGNVEHDVELGVGPFLVVIQYLPLKSAFTDDLLKSRDVGEVNVARFADRFGSNLSLR